jgi:hypothetical protein
LIIKHFNKFFYSNNLRYLIVLSNNFNQNLFLNKKFRTDLFNKFGLNYLLLSHYIILIISLKNNIILNMIKLVLLLSKKFTFGNSY